jgi:hypothetical protein
MANDKVTEITDVPEVVEDETLRKDHVNYDLIDKEVAQYASETIVEIDEETNKRLKRLIDKRVLFVMIFTYFIQALDKGTMSFASIMGIIDDTHLRGDQVRARCESWLETFYRLLKQTTVLVADHYHLSCHPHRRVPGKLHHSASPHWQVARRKYYFMGNYTLSSRRNEELPWFTYASSITRCL